MQALAESLHVSSKVPGPPKPYLISVEVFHQMGEMGLLGQDHHRLELLNGAILELMPIGQRHAAYVNRLTRLFATSTPEGFTLQVQNPVRLTRVSEPLPDISLIRGSEADYLKAPPGPADCALIIEVADTTLDYDLGLKARAYADANVGEYWIIDIEGRCVRVFRRPEAGEFRESLIAKEGDKLAVGVVPDLVFAVSDLLLPA